MVIVVDGFFKCSNIVPFSELTNKVAQKKFHTISIGHISSVEEFSSVDGKVVWDQ